MSYKFVSYFPCHCGLEGCGITVFEADEPDYHELSNYYVIQAPVCFCDKFGKWWTGIPRFFKRAWTLLTGNATLVIDVILYRPVANEFSVYMPNNWEFDNDFDDDETTAIVCDIPQHEWCLCLADAVGYLCGYHHTFAWFVVDKEGNYREKESWIQ